MAIVNPKNSDGMDHNALAQVGSTTGLLAASGDPIATSGGPEPYIGPTLVQGLRRDLVDRSGTLTSGGTAQDLAVALATRAYLIIQNVDAGEDLWIDFGTDAVLDQPSLLIPPRGAFIMDAGFVSGQRVSVNATTTGHRWTAKEA